MECESCEKHYPGKIIYVDRLGRCIHCLKEVDTSKQWNRIFPNSEHRWDAYFHHICLAVASKSPCLSRKIGAILVRDHSIVSTGYNGPPRGVPHCGHERMMNDKQLQLLAEFSTYPESNHLTRFQNECPRRVLGYESGTHMELCPAQHAEENAVSNAARLGFSIIDTILYMNSIIPCSKCFGTLINAGIKEIVVDDTKFFDKMTEYISSNSNIIIRRFQI